MKTIFIAGASGFIGRNLHEHLKHAYRLLTPQRQELNLLDKEEVDEYFAKKKIDVVINCAVIGGARPEKLTRSVLSENLAIFFNLLRNRDKYGKMIHFGSGAEYDKSKPIIKAKEEDFGKTIPLDDYGLFKYICSKCIEKEKNIIVLRIFGLFGKYEDIHHRFISNAILRNLNGLPIIIRQNVFFDYVYIDDFIQITDYFISANTHTGFFNVGTGKRIDLFTIANIINKVSERTSKIIIKNSGLGNEYTCDNSRLIKEIHNLHFTGMHDAIKALVGWYKDHQNELRL